MTNEEAVVILKNAIKKPNTEDGYLGQALTMAIKALEQEPITWIVGKDNCQVAVRNMPIDKMQKICAIIGEKEQQLKTIQEKQAESEKYQKAFDDGYENGYAQARFDYEQQPCEGMRDATEEERKSTKDYIDSISKPTGLQFDDIYEELDFVQPHKKISVNLQLCEDCISREEAINVVHKYFVKYLKLNDEICLDGIRSLPSVTPQQTRWIPVSERLPEENGRYLVTRGLNACGALWNRVYIVNYSDLMGLKSERIWWDGNVGKSDFKRIDDVVAWMPLPQPYKEGDANGC